MSTLKNDAWNFLIVSLLMTMPIVSKSQMREESEDIIITGEVTGEGKYSVYDEKSANGLYVKLTVTNKSNVDKKLLVMSCSWEENWQTDNQNLKLYYPGCDKNVSNEILLKPQKSIVFYGFLVRLVKSKANNYYYEYVSPRPPYDKWTAPSAGVRVRFGFVERCAEHLFQNEKIRNDNSKTWWSNPVSLQFDNNSFFVEE